MFSQMRIRGVGVIHDAVLDLSPGLNVLTGETGAGKTMVVSGLGMLLGERADSGLVRTGAGQALVEGVVQVPLGHRRSSARTRPAPRLSDGELVSRGRSPRPGGRGLTSAVAAPRSGCWPRSGAISSRSTARPTNGGSGRATASRGLDGFAGTSAVALRDRVGASRRVAGRAGRARTARRGPRARPEIDSLRRGLEGSRRSTRSPVRTSHSAPRTSASPTRTACGWRPARAGLPRR